ncbi:MAG TPA: thymidine phosphorylase [Anaerolineae bacterium]|nr:thymidine phosphorylase [Anaerolineae bacterium]
MNPVDIIVKKRDGGELSRAEIDFFVHGITAGSIPDYQAAAWAMAIYFRGMTDQEKTDLTLAMAASGDQFDLHGLFDDAVVIVDKHSSGGVGDKTTLAVGPIAAACGLPVAKMSGRGLSFSGGTIDKLESIAGFSVDISSEQFMRQLREIGLVIGSQTAELAPADGKLYALRDVTGTVPVLPLIASSIMSKKLASGADAIVLDVKVGLGAFMRDLDEASHLARLMVGIGRNAGRRMAAVISAMDQPLGRAVGNALELKEAIETLHGRGPEDFTQLVVTLAGEMLRLGGRPGTREELQALAKVQLLNGQAWKKFRQLIAAQGGDVAMIDDPKLLPAARLVEPALAPGSGWVAELRADQVGLVTVALGGGRQKKDDVIDHAVGVVLEAKVGDAVEAGQPLCWIHAPDEKRLAEARRRLLLSAYCISASPPAPPVLIHKIVE